MTMGPSNLSLAQNMGEIYCGILAVILFLGAGIGRRLLLAREIRFFSAALVLILLYALGWYTPAFRLMYDVMPGVDLFRRPADATFIIGFLIAVMTGYLVHRLLSAAAPQPLDPMASNAPSCLRSPRSPPASPTKRTASRSPCSRSPPALSLRPVRSRSLRRRGAWRRARPLLAIALFVAFSTFDLAWNNAPNESTGLPPSLYDALRPQTRNETVTLLRRSSPKPWAAIVATASN